MDDIPYVSYMDWMDARMMPQIMHPEDREAVTRRYETVPPRADSVFPVSK